MRILDSKLVFSKLASENMILSVVDSNNSSLGSNCLICWRIGRGENTASVEIFNTFFCHINTTRLKIKKKVAVGSLVITTDVDLDDKIFVIDILDTENKWLFLRVISRYVRRDRSHVK